MVNVSSCGRWSFAIAEHLPLLDRVGVKLFEASE
jgi:hypothetical protein